jgi:MerR family transcriptional regulator, light-induced transcriptional regulator
LFADSALGVRLTLAVAKLDQVPKISPKRAHQGDNHMDETHPVDTDIYQRVNTLFGSKRNSLPPEHIKHLATEVINRLSILGPPMIPVEALDIAKETVSEFCDLLLTPEPSAPMSFVLDLQARGVSTQLLRYGLIAGAARGLGELWDKDQISLIDVTVATGQLYALIRSIKDGSAGSVWARRTRPAALFALVPEETHTLGIMLATDTFRDAGWDIDLRLALSHDDLLHHVVSTEPTVVGLSFSTRDRLPDLIRLVLALRIVVPEAIIGVAPTLDMDEDEIFALVDVDLIFHDARIALNDLERLMRLQR